MKETRFIAQNKEKWQESENLLKDKVKDPEKLTNLFTQVIDDLSFSRTYYPNRSVRVYLNSIGKEYFNIIYNHKKEKRNRFAAFWMDELPQIVYQSRKQLTLSLVVFLFAIGIGVFSAMNDPQFTGSILGDTYVSMTKANIESGDPMAVYKSRHQVDMFLMITYNNIMVAFKTYVSGLFFSLGTLMALFYNGIMVGCFQYFFVEHGLFQESALTIWLHGTLEISSIILAGGAGLILGSGIVFPGSYSRLQSFQISGIRSLKLMLGITPIFIVAGLIESFLTRYTEVSDLLRLFLILLSAAFIIGYFVVYPWIKAKNGFDNPLEEAKLPPESDEKITYNKITNNAEILKDTFLLYKRNSGRLVGWIALVSFVAAFVEIFMGEPRSEIVVFSEEIFFLLTRDMFYTLKTPTIGFLVLNAVSTGLITYRVIMLIQAGTEKSLAKKYDLMSFLQILIICGMMYGMLFALGGFGILLLILACSFFLLLAFIQQKENLFLPQAIARLVRLCSDNFGKIIGLQIIVLLLMFSFLMILSAPVLYFNIEILQWNFAKTDEWAGQAIRFMEVFIKVFGFNLTIPVLAASASLLYFSLLEIRTADHLKRAIELVGSKTQKRRQ